MTGRRRGGGSHGSSGSHTTRRDSGGADTTRREGAPGGPGVGADVDAIDTMAGRLDATRTRVDGVGTTVRAVNVGPQSMGLLGSGFTGAAQSHLRTTEQHVTRTTQAIDKAHAGTRGTANAYRTTDATNARNLTRPDANTTVPAAHAQPTATSTRPGTTRQDAAAPNIAERLNPGAPPDPSRAQTPRPRTPITTPTGNYEPSPRERALLDRKVVNVADLDPHGHANDAYRTDFDDGSAGVYKPTDGEVSLRESVPEGGLAHREVAAYRLDEAFGFDLVPTTTIWDGHRGPGSMQEFVDDTTKGRDVSHYPRAQQEQMAVLDYVTGNTDRHMGNYLTGADGRLVAIDHGYSFPEGKDAYGIRSDFVAENLSQPLGDDVLARVRAVDPDEMRQMLQATGISGPAADGAVARLMEIQRHGMITGEAWPGRIHTADMRPVRGSIA